MSYRLLWTITGLIVLACGCGGNAGDDEVDNHDKPEEVLPLKKIAADGLPIGDEIPRPLDSGRLKAAKPKGWNTPVPNANYVIRFNAQAGSKIPHMVVKVAVAPSGKLETVTPDNVVEFATIVRNEIKENRQDGLILEWLRPMIIGGVPCVRYVKRASLRGADLESQEIVVQANGRRYTVSLRVMPDKLDENVRDAAYAFVASMKFIEKEKQPMGEQPGDQ